MNRQIDTFGAYVRAELDHWGREFALHRDCEYLGHQSKNMLAVLIEHEGEMPERPTGFRPLEVDQRALTIERIVSGIAEHNPVRACVLRGYYCGLGRRSFERREQALALAQAVMGAEFRLGKQKYFAEHDLGFAEVRGVLLGMARAA
jgi:hypothetical protein